MRSPSVALIFCVALVVFNCGKQTVRQFTNPLLPTGPDPWVTHYNGMYYITHSTGKNLKLYRTRSVSDLAQAESKVVWTPPATGMNSREIWAPELHRINNKWYFYYAADDCNNHNHRMWVVENSNDDPFEGEWVDKGRLNLPNDKWAIDGSIFEHEGSLYFVWSGWEGDVNVRQDIYITRMIDPWTPDSTRVLLSKPELPWEIKGASEELPTVNEGPQFLKHGNKIFIVYSASGCWTDDYSLGMLEASAGADLMNASSWTKSQQPVLQKDAEAHAFGAGHNSFFRSPDGTQDWIIYHANPEAGQGCRDFRSPRMQPFTWDSDDRPVFGKPVKVGELLAVPAGESESK
ncbi:MAG TPA: glycoside hydrolase family 43 protein [Cyclobacteriaceae bacterium]|nr:glycoside hydrolase family 43 protein [Cyclobacteriaceae bacterium]